MNQVLNLFTPFKSLSGTQKRLSTLVLVLLLLSLWSLSGSTYLPTPVEIIKAFPKLVTEKDIFYHFSKSVTFCFKAIGFATIVSLVFCYLSVLPVFATFCSFLRKFRFLPSTGLSFLFMKITADQGGQMHALMVWGVTTWLLDSMIGIALAITSDEIDYCKSLGLTKWQMMREVLIYGKAAALFQAVIANFAMAWTLLAAIENIAKANGGIGVVLAESNKYYKFEEVYAIQFLILATGILIDLSLNKIREIFFPYVTLNQIK